MPEWKQSSQYSRVAKEIETSELSFNKQIRQLSDFLEILSSEPIRLADLGIPLDRIENWQSLAEEMLHNSEQLHAEFIKLQRAHLKDDNSLLLNNITALIHDQSQLAIQWALSTNHNANDLPKLQEILTELKTPNSHNFQLLISPPYQRLPRYQLLFQEAHKHLSKAINKLGPQDTEVENRLLVGLIEPLGETSKACAMDLNQQQRGLDIVTLQAYLPHIVPLLANNQKHKNYGDNCRLLIQNIKQSSPSRMVDLFTKLLSEQGLSEKKIQKQLDTMLRKHKYHIEDTIDDGTFNAPYSADSAQVQAFIQSQDFTDTALLLSTLPLETNARWSLFKTDPKSEDNSKLMLESLLAMVDIRSDMRAVKAKLAKAQGIDIKEKNDTKEDNASSETTKSAEMAQAQMAQTEQPRPVTPPPKYSSTMEGRTTPPPRYSALGSSSNRSVTPPPGYASRSPSPTLQGKATLNVSEKEWQDAKQYYAENPDAVEFSLQNEQNTSGRHAFIRVTSANGPITVAMGNDALEEENKLEGYINSGSRAVLSRCVTEDGSLYAMRTTGIPDIEAKGLSNRGLAENARKTDVEAQRLQVEIQYMHGSAVVHSDTARPLIQEKQGDKKRAKLIENIVTLNHTNRLYEVIQLAPGRQLHGFLQSDKKKSRKNTESGMPIESRLKIAEAILAQIQALHNMDIIHRDIKPENFIINLNQEADITYKKAQDPSYLLQNEAEVFIIDMDMIADTGPSEVIKEPMLQTTHEYKAPESMKDGSYSKASDVYALGKLLFKDLSLFRLGFENKSVQRDHLLELINRARSDTAAPSERPTVAQLLTATENLIAVQTLHQVLSGSTEQAQDYEEDTSVNLGKGIEALKVIQEIDGVTNTESDDELDELDEFDELEGLEGLEGLDEFDELEGLEGLDGFDELEGLEGLEGPYELDEVFDLIKIGQNRVIFTEPSETPTRPSEDDDIKAPYPNNDRGPHRPK